ncbi:MAG: mechanosensitive ion channel [Gammaproteobacteria bacterium]|nr:mechanosensitive ion channel [Gammaproteobacteria bacterium]
MELNAEIIALYIIPWAVKIITALAIFYIGRMIAKSLTGFVKQIMRKSKTDEALVSFLSSIIYTVLLIAVILAAVDQLGVNVTSLLAILSVAGLAVGLALKDSLSNFAAGIMILIFRPFKIGDFVTIGGTSGVVDEIGLFCVLMHTGDNQRIIIPNSAVYGNTITNTSALPTRRIDLVMGIGYDDNIGTAKNIILEIIASDERILAEPEPVIAVAELADSSVNLVVRPWVNAADYWAVRFHLLETMKVKLEEGGISIPYPQRDIHVYNEDSE